MTLRRFLLIASVVTVSSAQAAFTEFYCQTGGSNLNGGSDTSNSAKYTSTNGNWSTTTNIFTPTDGSNPVTAGVAVGDFASIYIDAASVGVYIARVTAVTNAANGTITVSASAIAGSAPTTNATARSIKVGGAWNGPNGASGFPFTLLGWGNNQDSSAHLVRTNLKNDHTYSVTASFAFGAGKVSIVQGYTSAVNDGGKFTWDGGTSTGALITDVGIAGVSVIDGIFSTSITSGSTDLVAPTRASNWIRCVFTGARQKGLNLAGTSSTVIESEAYACNKANAATTGAFHTVGPGTTFLRCYAHDNTGSNTFGFLIGGGGPAVIQDSIADTNGKYGIGITGTTQGGPIVIANCDLYNNTSDGVNIISTAVNPIWIENCNLLKNGGAGINNAATGNFGFVYNCGYGSGTQANGSADTLNGFAQSGTVTYASGVTPWNAPVTGDFSVILSAAIGAGRAVFTETDGTNTGTVSYPDIGAARSLPSTDSGIGWIGGD